MCVQSFFPYTHQARCDNQVNLSTDQEMTVNSKTRQNDYKKKFKTNITSIFMKLNHPSFVILEYFVKKGFSYQTPQNGHWHLSEASMVLELSCQKSSC